jgi:ABC-type transport system substrate-binding protein
VLGIPEGTGRIYAGPTLAALGRGYFRDAGLDLEVVESGGRRGSIPMLAAGDLDVSRWAGGNRGCCQNPEMDRTIEALTTAIEPDAQRRLYRDLVRMQSEEFPVLPLYFNVQITVFRDGVLGVKGDTQPRTSVSWNVTEWDLR